MYYGYLLWNTHWYYTTCSDWVNAPGAACWVQSSLVYSVWRGLLQGLVWAGKHMDPGSDRYRLSFARRGSLACLLASHVTGWFSRPDNNHPGWKEVYAILDSNRASPSSFMMHREVFALTAFNTLCDIGGEKR